MGWAKPLKKLLYALPAPAFWLGVWQACACLVDRHVGGRGNELLLPYPVSVWNALVSMIGTGDFWAVVLASLGRIALGLGAGIVLGAMLALLTCASPWAERLLAPAIRVVRAAPVASFILLVLLWTGRNRVPAVISAMMVLPVVWDSLCRGIQSIDPKRLELARVYRFSRWKTLWLIGLPSLRPHIPPDWPGSPAWRRRCSACPSPPWDSGFITQSIIWISRSSSPGRRPQSP